MTEDRPTTDGGEPAAPLDVQRAGNSPPEPPGEDGIERELPDLLGDAERVSTAYLVRAALASGSGRAVGDRLVGALEDKVTVVGSTLDAGLDPASPEVDVLIETDHDPAAIASSLASVGPVDGVVVVDVTAAAERALEDDSDEVDAADANDVFNELKDEIGQEGYGTVVDELEDVSFPGGPDPDEEVDLEAETGVELTDDDGTLDLEDDDELSTKQLLGEEERDETTEVKAPDEKAIEEAIEEVELGTGSDGHADDGGDAGGLNDGVAGASAGDAADHVDDDAEYIETAAGSTDESAVDGKSGDDGPGDEPAVESPSPADGPDAAAPPSANSSDGPADRSAGAGPGSPGEMDAFVAGLVEALETGAIDEERRTRLREALGIESTHSLDVRLEYLQKRVDNLAAYTDAWEAFLSEQGAGREFMESVKGDIEAIEARLDDVEGGSDGDLDEVTERLQDIERQLSSLADRHDDDVARLDTRMDSVESKLVQRVDAVEDALGALKEKISALLEWREHIDDVLGDS